VATQPTAVLSRMPKPGSGEVITPVKVKTITVKAGQCSDRDAGARWSRTRRRPALRPQLRAKRSSSAAAGARPGVLGVLPVEPASQPGTYQMASATSVPVQLAPASTQAARKIDPRRPG